MTMTTQAPPERPAHWLGGDGFDERFAAALNHAALMLVVSVGHRTGLLDAMAELEWTTSTEVAGRAGLDERYVREWLGAMATGGIVEVDGRGGFLLPAAHAAFLTRSAGAQNLAVFAQYIGVLGGVEDDIVACFHNGGGVPYERFPRFHEVMAEDSGMTVLSALEDAILPLVPGLTERLEAGARVLDVGCGRGRALLQLAGRFPATEFDGIDLSEEALGWGRAEAERRGLANLRFEARDASDFDRTAAPEQYDLVLTFDAIHDQARPRNVLRGIARTLKPDGVYLMQDIHASSHVHTDLDHPLGPFLYTASCMHCTPVSLAQGGEGLGTMWGREKATELLREAGFRDIRIHRLDHDVQNDYYVVRK
jgi:SAM-dependent methyltransferase